MAGCILSASSLPIVQKKLFIALETSFLFRVSVPDSLRQSMLLDFDLLLRSSLIVSE